MKSTGFRLGEDMRVGEVSMQLCSVVKARIIMFTSPYARHIEASK